jgi:DNA-directed RNA polymerase subunit RPC12/RpoP
MLIKRRGMSTVARQSENVTNSIHLLFRKLRLVLLVCSRRCGGRLFRALFAEVDLDAGGAYQDHRIAQPAYICLNCGSPAFDLSEVPGEMNAEAEADAPTAGADILCPVCETLVQVDAGMECPNCGAPLEVAEGR